MADEKIEVPEGAFAIPNVKLERFEKAVNQRDYEGASQLLLEALRLLRCGAMFHGYPRDDRIAHILYSRLSASILSLFTDPRYMISPDGFRVFAAEHPIMDLVIRLSAFETSDHVLPSISENPDEEDRTKLKITNADMLVKFLLTYSLRSGFSLDFESTFKNNPQLLFSLWCGMLAPQLTTANTAHNRREVLLGLHHVFENVELTESVMPTLSDAYMYSSYGSRVDKHAMKGLTHRLFAAYILRKKFAVPTPREIRRRRRASLDLWDKGGKPTLLVCIEWFTAQHAMFRCYAPIIRQLKKKFYIVGMGRINDTDSVGRAEFDEWHTVPGNGLEFGRVIDEVNKISPDVMYYPSLGMGVWWVALASVRMAPVQVMTLGHPASSQSPAMDYVLCDEGAIGDRGLFTEEIIEYPIGTGRYQMRPDAPDTDALREAKTAQIRKTGSDATVMNVAVPAMVCKLNATFLQALKRIEDGAGREVVFHFWVNMIGTPLLAAAYELRQWLKNVRVYERCDYPSYLQAISGCDLMLSTFPFGGTNSVIDALLVGVPVITLWGNEPHTRFDGQILHRALPSDALELIAKTPDEYVTKATDLLQFDSQRWQLRDRILAVDLLGEFYEPAPDYFDTTFVDAMGEAFHKGPRS